MRLFVFFFFARVEKPVMIECISARKYNHYHSPEHSRPRVNVGITKTNQKTNHGTNHASNQGAPPFLHGIHI